MALAATPLFVFVEPIWRNSSPIEMTDKQLLTKLGGNLSAMMNTIERITVSMAQNNSEGAIADANILAAQAKAQKEWVIEARSRGLRLDGVWG